MFLLLLRLVFDELEDGRIDPEEYQTIVFRLACQHNKIRLLQLEKVKKMRQHSSG